MKDETDYTKSGFAKGGKKGAAHQGLWARHTVCALTVSAHVLQEKERLARRL